MSRAYNTRVCMNNGVKSGGYRPPLAEPENCKNHCPYGYGKSFCFPCMAKIMAEHRAAKKE